MTRASSACRAGAARRERAAAAARRRAGRRGPAANLEAERAGRSAASLLHGVQQRGYRAGLHEQASPQSAPASGGGVVYGSTSPSSGWVDPGSDGYDDEDAGFRSAVITVTYDRDKRLGDSAAERVSGGKFIKRQGDKVPYPFRTSFSIPSRPRCCIR